MARSTWPASGTHTLTTSQVDASSAPEAATSAPSFTMAAVAAVSRSNTDTGTPTSSSRPAMAVPNCPIPT